MSEGNQKIKDALSMLASVLGPQIKREEGNTLSNAFAEVSTWALKESGSDYQDALAFCMQLGMQMFWENKI